MARRFARRLSDVAPSSGSFASCEPAGVSGTVYTDGSTVQVLRPAAAASGT